MNPKLNSTVSVVKINEHILEFFLTNIRQQVRIKVEDDLILEIVTALDGKRTISQLVTDYDISEEELTGLLDFMRSRGLLDNVDPKEDFKCYEQFRRVIHFLAEYSHSHEHLLEMWNRIRNSTVLIVGL